MLRGQVSRVPASHKCEALPVSQLFLSGLLSERVL